jgi:uncharacterized iron-regulated protein
MLTSMRNKALAVIALLGLHAAFACAADLLIFGEVHDQPDQQRQVADEVQRLAAAGRLAAVVLEMAEVPHSSAGLPRDASEAQVQQALKWRGWAWDPYAAVVMNAVRAGVPVLGGNLPREQMRAAMADAGLDAAVPPMVRELFAQEVRDGHCGLLPEAQVPGMVRIQIARDRSLAATASQASRDASAQQTVLLLAGAQHASRDRGIPLHLAQTDPRLPVRVVMFGDLSAKLAADERRSALPTPQADHCAELKRSLDARAAASAPSTAPR